MIRIRQTDRTKWSIAILLLALAVWGLTDVRNRGRVNLLDPTVHKTDVTVYTGAGAAMFDGRDPYAVASPRGWHYLYPPLFAILISPLARLDPQWQSVSLFWISVLAGWGCYVECRRLWAWLRTSSAREATVANRLPRWILWLAAATILLPALNCLQRGQLGLLMLYPLLLGFRWAVSSRTWAGMAAGGMAMAFPVAVKLTPALPVGFVCWQLLVAAWLNGTSAMLWRRAAAASAGVAMGLVLFLLALPSLIVGPAKNVEYLQTWVHRVAANKEPGPINGINVRSKRNQSLSNAVYRLGNWTSYELGGAVSDEQLDVPGINIGPTLMDQTAVNVALMVIRAVLLALLFAAGWAAARSGDHLSMALAAAMAGLATLLISPLSWGHYYVIWLPAAALAPGWLWWRGRTQLAAGLATAACGLVWAHYVLLPWTGRIGLLGIGTTVWFAVVCLAMVQMKPAVRLTAAVSGEAGVAAGQVACAHAL